jgi:hypothetical protein
MYRVFICPECLCVVHLVQYCAECRHSVHASVTVRSEHSCKLCTENTRYNVKYAECFACVECKGNLSRENVYQVCCPECHTRYILY